MEFDQIALQQALLSQTTLTTQTTAIIITAQLTLFFGYFGALYLFLRTLSVWVRGATFFFYALANTFLAAGHSAVQAVHKRTLEWRAAAINDDQLPSYFTESSVQSYGLMTAIVEVLLHVLNFGAVFFILYVTFFYKWKTADK